MAGRTPQPTALKIVRGNPGKRALNKREPRPGAGRPEMPKSVAEHPRAKEEWERLCPMLERMRVLTEADYLALANLCYDVWLNENAQTHLRNSGLIVVTKKTGMLHLSPLLHLISVTTDRITRACREFGLTPASRSNLQTTAGTPEHDPWDEI